MSTILEVRNLKKYFNTKNGLLHAVDNVSFSIEEGRTLGVVGESGCGKSTLGRVVLHLLPATEGQILFCGEDISNPKKTKLHELRRNMQMVFQDPYSSLNPRQSVAEIIGEPLKVYHVCKSKQELDERVREIMDTVGLPERYQHSYPHELDGGRRQRIGIGRALALNPKFIVCDEPVSALDVSIQAQIINLLKDLQEEYNLTYLFISHDLSVVEHISDTVGVMYLGNLVEYSSTEKVFSHPLHPYTEALFSAIPVPDPDYQMKRIILEGSIPSPSNPPSGCKFHTRCSKCMEVCKHCAPDFREIEPDHFCACHLYNTAERQAEFEAMMKEEKNDK